MTTYQFAGFWRRFIAYMIDGFIISVVFLVMAIVVVIAYVAGAISGGGAALTVLADPNRMAEINPWIWLFSIFMNIIYFTYFHGSTGRTPGKMLLGLQVISVYGTVISFGTAFLRSVGYLVSSVVFCLGYIWIAFDKKKQGWHDKIAGTVVIIREPQARAAGISIPDSSGLPQNAAQLNNSSSSFSQTEMNKPETQSDNGD